MKNVVRLAILASVLLPALAFADERWYWATAQCSDEDDETVYMFAALVDITTDIDPDSDEPQESKDHARFGFGNYAEDTYAEQYCGVAEITAQNMYATSSFDTREEAEASLDDYVAREEADDRPWLKIIRVDEYDYDSTE
ncbi:hypothetical protein DWG18_11800 [Lysobacter sp. TY2-98]|uniref:hypothetical protein n=1 Tax=Lysobacter sp. TY2-98 TaxID=2290922 RepID=UPI000E203D42|nr:hypothetical protein [Lysobacter sp. TY2-98]AXK72891.1 hypothetical protein DWG18_11800 [Lysobacter sp. TY2-98]